MYERTRQLHVFTVFNFINVCFFCKYLIVHTLCNSYRSRTNLNSAFDDDSLSRFFIQVVSTFYFGPIER